MNFAINNVSLDYHLAKLNIPLNEREEWLIRIRDDFNENVSNDDIVKTLLSMSQSKLREISESANVDSSSDKEKNDFNIRLRLFSVIIDDDYVNYQRFCRLKRDEPRLMERYSHSYFDINHLVIMFEEYEE